MCVLQHWRTNPKDYAAAIQKINYSDTAKEKSSNAARKLKGKNTEYRKRAHALNQIRKALFSLTKQKKVRRQRPSNT